jgi:hypothetical protein
VPGIGSAAGAVLAGAASLAAGKSIDEAALDAAAGAIPGGIIATNAFTAGREVGEAILDGQPLDELALDLGRAAARTNGGELAAAAWDAAVILGRGKALQDAGFAVLRGFVPGTTIAERSIAYAAAIARGVATGQALPDLLVAELGAEVRAAGPALLGPVIARVSDDPTLRDVGSEAFAFAERVPEPVARAAQAVVREDGTIDRVTLEALLQLGATETAFSRQGQVGILTADPSLLYSYRAPVTAGAMVFDPSMTWSSQHPAAQRPAPAIVATVAPPAPLTSKAPAIVGGLAVAAALGGLYLWATDGGRT